MCSGVTETMLHILPVWGQHIARSLEYVRFLTIIIEDKLQSVQIHSFHPDGIPQDVM